MITLPTMATNGCKMTWINTIHSSAAKGRLKDLYQRITSSSGQIDNILLAHSLRPHTLAGHMALYKAVLHHPANQVEKWFLEAIGVYVSRLNQCNYCDRHHSEGLKRLLDNQQRYQVYRKALNRKAPGEPFSEAEQAVLAYVRKLTRDPASVQQTDCDGLRQAGYTDGEILEINQVAAYFAYANRMVTGLGIDSSGEQLGLSPGDSEDPENWQHG